jgi:hypothetical protein
MSWFSSRIIKRFLSLYRSGGAFSLMDRHRIALAAPSASHGS